MIINYRGVVPTYIFTICSRGRGCTPPPWQTHTHPLSRPTRQTPPSQTHPRQTHTHPSPPIPPRDGHCSRRYASYWNTFLFCKIFAQKNCVKMKKNWTRAVEGGVHVPGTLSPCRHNKGFWQMRQYQEILTLEMHWVNGKKYILKHPS